jgi:hypothetical protein
MEKRKGKSRLQGFYGADAGIYIGSTKDKFTYGNALAGNLVPASAVNVTTSDDFAGDADAATAGYQLASNANIGTPSITGMNTGSYARMTEKKSGVSVSFGVRAFIGAEYFILPKVSLGGEFGWGLGLSMTGKSTTTWESIGAAQSATSTSVGSTEIEGGKSSTFGLDTDGRNGVFGPSASLRLALHF